MANLVNRLNGAFCVCEKKVTKNDHIIIQNLISFCSHQPHVVVKTKVDHIPNAVSTYRGRQSKPHAAVEGEEPVRLANV